MRIAIAAEVCSFELMKAIKAHLLEQGHEVLDFGMVSEDEKMVFYETAPRVAQAVQSGEAERGILMCGTGMGLDYPGGPEIAKLARDGDPQAIDFPRGLMQADTYDFSFSGLKTAAINYIHTIRQRGDELPVEDIAASLQASIVDVLVSKTVAAAREYQVRTVLLSGGVAANESLRRQLRQVAGLHGLKVYYPTQVLCTDNAAMIACAGYYRYRRGERSPWDLNAVPNLRLGEA